MMFSTSQHGPASASLRGGAADAQGMIRVMAIAFGLGSMLLVGLGWMTARSDDSSSPKAEPPAAAAENFFDGVDGVPPSAVAPIAPPMPPEVRTTSARTDLPSPAKDVRSAPAPEKPRQPSGTGYVYRDALRPALAD